MLLVRLMQYFPVLYNSAQVTQLDPRVKTDAMPRPYV